MKKYLSVLPCFLLVLGTRLVGKCNIWLQAMFMLSPGWGIGKSHREFHGWSIWQKTEVQCKGTYSTSTSWFPPEHVSSLSLLCFCVLADLAITGEDKVTTHTVCGLVKEHHYYPGVTQTHILAEVNGYGFSVTQNSTTAEIFPSLGAWIHVLLQLSWIAHMNLLSSSKHCSCLL